MIRTSSLLFLIGFVGSAANSATITAGLGSGFDFNSIQAAIAAAAPGDTISVAPGIYTEGTALYRGNNFSTGLLFSQISDISLIGAGIGSTYIDFGGAYYGLVLDETSNIRVSGFTMWNSTTFSFSNLNNTGQSGNLIEDVVFGPSLFGEQNFYPSAVRLSNVSTDLNFSGPLTPVPLPGSGLLLSVILLLAGAYSAVRRFFPKAEQLA